MITDNAKAHLASEEFQVFAEIIPATTENLVQAAHLIVEFVQSIKLTKARITAEIIYAIMVKHAPLVPEIAVAVQVTMSPIPEIAAVLTQLIGL